MVTMAIASCSNSSVTYYEHEPTQQKRRHDYKHYSAADFETSSPFVDSGILFVPQVRELAWGEDHRSFVTFYSKNQRLIKVDRIELSNEQQDLATLEVDQIIRINSLADGSKLFRGSVPALFGNATDTDKVLAGRSVSMTLYYRLPVGSMLKKKQFSLTKKVQIGRAFRDTIAAE